MRTINGIALDTFTEHYAICALWSSTDDSNDQGGQPLDANYGLDDITAETLQRMAADCADFQKACAQLLDESGQSAEQSGHDFWLTRNRHGAGFWDRGLGKVGKDLTDMAHPYGECNLYVGDDQKIHAY